MRQTRSIAVFLALLVLSACGAGAAESAAAGTARLDPVRSVQTAASTLSDIPADAWYAEAAVYCLEQGWMDVASANAFSPGEPASRGVLVTALHRRAGSPAPEQAAAFTDIPAGAAYRSAAAWAAEQGIAAGYGDGRFGGGDPVTREQFAVMLWRAEGRPAPDTASVFADQAELSAHAADAAAWARSAGIISGRKDGRFDPRANITRGEAAVMLYRWAHMSEEKTPDSGGILVAYFSATGTTRSLAEHAADILGGDLYEIVPAVPYTADDLRYYTGGRADREQADPAVRPAVSGQAEHMGRYDIILLGYPIWHGQAPRVISTFLESYDLSGKTIVPFCTSHSSGIGSSDTDLHALAAGASWLPGRRFSGGASRSEMASWLNGLDLRPAANGTGRAVFDLETGTVTLNSGYPMPLNGLGTYSLHGETCVRAVKDALASGVRLIDTASAYGNEREVGRAVREAMAELNIPREEIFVITKIYPGSEMADPEKSIQACLDRLDIGYVDMMLLHHPDPNDVKAYRVMEKFVEAGKIRSLGLSNWYVKELESFLPQVSVTPALVQNEIHPYYQENDVIPYVQGLGITVQGWYPLGGRGHTAELLGDEVISAIAAAHGKSSAQVILRWNLQKGVVVIPGSSNTEHIRENTELYDFALTDDEMVRINALDRGEKHDWY